MTQQSYEENLYLLESYKSARQRLYAYMKKLEGQLRVAREPSETDGLERRLLLLYGELDDTALAIRALEAYCQPMEATQESDGVEKAATTCPDDAGDVPETDAPHSSDSVAGEKVHVSRTRAAGRTGRRTYAG